mmetsp:Transcript_88924/g.276418  ORF Transcript_88924/g.276418 Transcript_88924/m.276418 type:complete len:178 (-) Transcript_88924:30-563(-)
MMQTLETGLVADEAVDPKGEAPQGEKPAAQLASAAFCWLARLGYLVCLLSIVLALAQLLVLFVLMNPTVLRLLRLVRLVQALAVLAALLLLLRLRQRHERLPTGCEACGCASLPIVLCVLCGLRWVHAATDEGIPATFESTGEVVASAFTALYLFSFTALCALWVQGLRRRGQRLCG